MEKKMKRIEFKVWYFDKDENKVEGVHSNIRGDVSDIRGDVSGISGDVSNIRGDVSGISGDVSGISGNIDKCSITSEDRKNGVNIEDLIGD